MGRTSTVVLVCSRRHHDGLNEVTAESGLEILIDMFPDAENQLRVLDDANRPNAPLGAFAVTCHVEYIVDDLVDMQCF